MHTQDGHTLTHTHTHTHTDTHMATCTYTYKEHAHVVQRTLPFAAHLIKIQGVVLIEEVQNELGEMVVVPGPM